VNQVSEATQSDQLPIRIQAMKIQANGRNLSAGHQGPDIYDHL